MLILKPFTKDLGRSMLHPSRGITPQREFTRLHSHCAFRVCHPNTRIHVRLLGPCFKTGRRKPFRQGLGRTRALHARATHTTTALPRQVPRQQRYTKRAGLPIACAVVPRSLQRYRRRAVTGRRPLGGRPYLPATLSHWHVIHPDLHAGKVHAPQTRAPEPSLTLSNPGAGPAPR